MLICFRLRINLTLKTDVGEQHNNMVGKMNLKIHHQQAS